MGLVYHLECPACKKKVYIGAHVSQIQCPECKQGTIVNVKCKLSSKTIEKSQRFVFSAKNQESKTSTCPQCNTQFTTPPPLFRGKVYCPSCGTEVKLEGVTQI